MSELDLASRGCVPCTGNTPTLVGHQRDQLLTQIPLWKLNPDGCRLTRVWRVRDFLTAVAFINRIAEVAEANDHHPDIHLVNYRELSLELTTHAAGGLTENDLILAAKIDRLESPRLQG